MEQYYFFVNMTSEFDPYRIWLSIPPSEQPANYYRLLGLPLFESDPDVISGAADRQMTHVRTFQTGKYSELSQKILNELSAARITLLDQNRKSQYDAELRATMESSENPAPEIPDSDGNISAPPPPIPFSSSVDDAPALPQFLAEIQENRRVPPIPTRDLPASNSADEPSDLLVVDKNKVAFIAAIAVTALILLAALFAMTSGSKSQKVAENKQEEIQEEKEPVDSSANDSVLDLQNDDVQNVTEIEIEDRIVKVVNGVEFAFRYCPAGKFVMGSPESEVGRNKDEKQHEVTLSKGFWIMESEVTQRQWQAVMGNNPSKNKGDDLPVEQVSWNDCQEFCKKCVDLGFAFQLPTEAQWEYACRAGTTGAFADDLDAMAWHDINSEGVTHPVGMKMSNDWDLYDMHGNVWEWCLDWKADYPGGSVTDPVSSSGTQRVYRGGGWSDGAWRCRSACRIGAAADYRDPSLGFRCVKTSDD